MLLSPPIAKETECVVQQLTPTENLHSTPPDISEIKDGYCGVDNDCDQLIDKMLQASKPPVKKDYAEAVKTFNPARQKRSSEVSSRNKPRISVSNSYINSSNDSKHQSSPLLKSAVRIFDLYVGNCDYHISENILNKFIKSHSNTTIKDCKELRSTETVSSPQTFGHKALLYINIIVRDIIDWKFYNF